MIGCRRLERVARVSPNRRNVSPFLLHACRQVDGKIPPLSVWCILKLFHTGYQSHAGGQSTLAAALDMDSLPTNHAECSSPFQRVSIQAGGNGGGGAGGGALLPGSKREQVGRACSGDVASAGESGRYHLALIRAGACVRVRDGRCMGRGE